MSFDDFDGGCEFEPYDGDDLEALGQQESWEHSRGEVESDEDEFTEADRLEPDTIFDLEA